MRYLALACDYDETLATHGRVAPATLTALERIAATDRRLVLVTGRELADLISTFPEVTRFDRVVAENGAVMFRPGSGETEVLANAPEPGLVERLRACGVTPLSVGRSIVATREPYEAAAVETIRALGLPRHVILNKGAVMLLPAGVDKATGLVRALEELGIPPDRAVGVGDAENDLCFLQLCGLAVAVGNALPALADQVDLVTEGEAGDGVVELIERLLEERPIIGARRRR
jgi:HAD superfamily hydrolase (TIGR01484 family)